MLSGSPKTDHLKTGNEEMIQDIDGRGIGSAVGAMS